MAPISHTQQPIVTGTSVLGVKYAGGVMLAADTLGSYGSLARFKDVRRIISHGDNILVGAGGDISDFIAIEKMLEELAVETACIADGLEYSPREVYTWLTRMMYHRRTKMNPLWNDLVIAGVDKDGASFLGTTTMIGTSYEHDFICTGFGSHMALPILRNEWKEGMSKTEAEKLLRRCLEVLSYRDCRTVNKITFATADTATGKAVVADPVTLDTEWSYKTFVTPM